MKGVTQEECADYFGVSLTTYNRWENNLEELVVRKAKEIVIYLSGGTMTLDDMT